ncbi:hypothetical protein [Roseibium sp. M-1]
MEKVVEPDGRELLELLDVADEEGLLEDEDVEAVDPDVPVEDAVEDLGSVPADFADAALEEE